MKAILKEVNLFFIDCIHEFVNIIIIMSLFLIGFVVMPLCILQPIF